MIIQTQRRCFFSGFIHLNSLIVNGILNLDILDVDYSNEVTCGSTTCTEISAELLLPSISLSTGYDADVTLFDTLRVYGNGNIRYVNMENVFFVSIY